MTLSVRGFAVTAPTCAACLPGNFPHEPVFADDARTFAASFTAFAERVRSLTDRNTTPTAGARRVADQDLAFFGVARNPVDVARPFARVTRTLDTLSNAFCRSVLKM